MMLKRMLGGLTALLALAILLPAIASGQSLEERKAQKLSEPWLKKADWVLDYDEALANAKESGKIIFAYFTRSYAP